MNLPSVKTIETRLEVSREIALSIRKSLEKARDKNTYRAIDVALEEINTVLEGHGVEPMRGTDWNRHYGDINALYVNMGDSYICTVLYDTTKEKFYVTDWASFVETDEARFSL